MTPYEIRENKEVVIGEIEKTLPVRARLLQPLPNSDVEAGGISPATTTPDAC